MSPNKCRWWALLALALALAGAVVLWRELRRARRAVAWQSQRKEAQHAMRLELQSQLPIGPASVVLIGDSHLDLMPAHELLGLPDVVNLGIGGSTINDVLERLPALARQRPARVVLLAGINDLRTGATAADCADRMGRCLALLREAGVPATVIAIPPHSKPAMQATVEAANQLIAVACEHHAADLLDPTPLLLRNGVLDPALTFDGLHLNAEGYLRLAGALRAHLQAKVAE